MNVPGTSFWKLTSIGRPRDNLNITIAIGTTSETVLRAVEAAAERAGLVLERVADDDFLEPGDPGPIGVG